MDEADLVSAAAHANSAGGEAHALSGEPLHRDLQIVYPQADVVERGLVHRGLLARIERLHQVDLHAQRPCAERGDVFVDVLALAAKGVDDLQAEQIDPELAQALLVEAADGDLLQPENAKRTLAHLNSLYLNFRMA